MQAAVSPQKIVIDTDPGQDIDDLLAIHFALLRPELDVRAITTVTYPTDRRARLVNRLLRYLGRTDIPVAAGMQQPLRPFSAEEWRTQRDPGHSMNHSSFAEPEDPRDAAGSLDAVDLIIRTVEAHPGEVALACIAPLTNIAAALCRKPEIAGQIPYIAMMGGETAQLRAEHNVAFDAVAAEIVLASGIPIYMGTWSVTRRFTLTMADCEVYHRHSAEVVRALGAAITQWHPHHQWKPGPVMYDLFPMVWAFDRTLYTVEPMPVQVETQGTLTRGMTLSGGSRKNIHVTTDAKAEALRDLFLSTVLREH